jgi:hypothetical protein
MSNTYLIYQVEAFEKFDPVTQQYYNVKRIEVIASSEDEAIEKAKTMVKSNNYEVRSCLEKHYDKNSS